MVDSKTQKGNRILPYVVIGLILTMSIFLKMSGNRQNQLSEENMSTLRKRKLDDEDPIFGKPAKQKHTTEKVNITEDIIEITTTTPKTIAMKILHAKIDVERVESIESVVANTVEMTDDERKIYWSDEVNKKIFRPKPPNADFIFHNKLPKSGSTTMNAILLKLSHLNKFNFQKLSPLDLPETAKEDLIKFLNKSMTKPYFLLKHHHLLNFSKFNEDEPTYINVVREPTSWFASKFYFTRNGWKRNPKSRANAKEGAKTIENCIKNKEKDCTLPTNYLTFFCGMEHECSVNTPSNKRKAVERAKYNALHTFYVIGVLEKFEETLKLLEVLLPRYYRNDVKAWNSSGVQFQQTSTKTVKKKTMSTETKQYLMNNLLKEECELYEFITEIFTKRLRMHGIE